MSIDLIWFDNRIHYDEKWLFKDSYYGLNNLRVSVLPNGSIQHITWFRNGNVLLYLVSPTDFSAITEFISLTPTSNSIVIRYMFECGLSSAFNTSSLSIGHLIHDTTSRSVFRYLHVCDTHHGVNPISSAVRFAKDLNPHFLSCNQLHHLHFFDCCVFLNLPRASIDNVHIYNFLSSSDVYSSSSHFYFPVVRNNIHIKRYSMFESLNSCNLRSLPISSQRFSHYPDWLKHFATSSAFIYVPLGTSIGLNNIIPAAITNTPVYSYRLTDYTGQSYLYSYLNLRSFFFSNVDELKMLCSSFESSSQISINHHIYRKLLPTAKQFYHMILSQSGVLFNSLHPSLLDSRFNLLQSLATSVDQQLLFKYISLYENLQCLFELFPSIIPSMLRIDSLDVDSTNFRYLSNIVKDIATFKYFDLSFDITPVVGSVYIFCLLDCHIPYLSEIISKVPKGSFFLTATQNSQFNDQLRQLPQISCPFSNRLVPDIFLLS